MRPWCFHSLLVAGHRECYFRARAEDGDTGMWVLTE